MSYTFNSYVKELSPFATEVGNNEIKNEAMFFNSDLDFAYSNGGPITRSFIDSLPEGLGPCVFDSRVHMLMPGWYPAIPGFHHDDVPRPPIPVGQHFVTAGQPDYDTPRYRSKHILGLVNADICPTEFAIGTIELPEVEGLIYREWHPLLKEAVGTGEMLSYSTPDRKLISFDCESFHQGVRAVSNGWRWFGRVSYNTERTSSVTNEIRQQVQVYLEFPMEGW